MLRLLSVLVLIFTIGVGNAWGTNYSFLSSIPSGWSVSPNQSSFESGNNGSNTFGRGACWSSGADPTISASGISGTITGVSIKASTNAGASKASISVTVGTTSFKNNNNNSVYISSGTASANADYAFTGSATGTIEVSINNSVSNKSVYVSSITVTTSSGSTYTITYADTNGEGTNGTYSASSTSSITSGTTITLSATPANCYELNAWDVYKTGASGTKVSVSNNQFTMPAYNVTVGATFQEKATGKTVNFDAGAGIYTGGSLQEDCAGAGITLPSVDASSICKGWTTFAGWRKSSGITATDSTTTNPGTLYKSGDTYYPLEDNETLYAVFSKVKGSDDVVDVINNDVTSSHLGNFSASSWVSVWETSALSSGAKYKIYSMGINGASDYALQWNGNGYLFCSSAPASGLKLKSIRAITKASKDLGLYGSTTAYTGKASSMSLGTLSATTSGNTYSLTSAQLENNYSCVGINGTASSTQIVSISITYSASTTYYCSDPNCCEPLGSINGSFFWPTHFCPAWPAKHRS